MKQYGLAALASVLAAISSANAFVLVDTEAGAAVNQASPVPCAGQLAAVDCQMAPRDDLLFKGVANKLTCLAASSNTLSKECFLGEVDSTLDFIVEQQGSKCKDELRSKCGKQIDALKKAIEHTSVIGTVKGAVDVVECIVNHAEDLWNHCKPGQKAQEEATLVDPVEENTPSCEARAVELCPTTQHKVLGLGFTLGCLVEKAPVLGNGCAHERIAAALDDLENSADRPCHDELRKKCGKQIDQLKKEIQSTSVLGTLKAAVDVVQCVAQNAEDLWNKCKPFEAEMQDNDEPEEEIFLDERETSGELAFVAGAPTPPTRKPTHKPTHRPTKRPTNKPTLRPTSKPTKSVSPTTSRPTPRKISEYLVNNVVVVESEEPIALENRMVDEPARPYPHHDDDDRRPRPHPNHDDDDRPRPHPHHDDDDRPRPRPHPHHDDDDRRPCPHHHDDEHHRHHHRHHGHGGGMMMDTRGGVHFSNKMEEVEMMGEDGELVEAGFEFDMEECVRSARKFCAAEVADFNASPFDRNLLEAMNGCIERNAAIIEADCMVRSVEVYRFDPPHGHGYHRCRKFWKHVAAGVFALIFTLVLARKCYVRRMKAKLASQGEVVQAEPQYQPLVDAKGPSMV